MSGPINGYELLKTIVHLSNTSIEIKEKLQRMLQSIAEAFHVDRCLLLGPDEIEGNETLSRLAREKRAFGTEGGSFAYIPVCDETSFYGLLQIAFAKKEEFSPEEADLLLLISKEMARAIRNSCLHLKSEQILSEWTAFYEMGKAITSTLKLEDLLRLILETGLKILQAKGGVLRLEDKRTQELKVKCSLGGYDQNPLDERIAKRVFFTQTLFSLNHSGEGNPSHSILCAPLLSKGRGFGTLAFYEKDREPSRFDERDSQLLLTMANQMSCAIENALTHYETSRAVLENEKRVKQLSTLCELNKALLTTVHFERILHLILTAVTIGDGLGFNRAMLFLVDEKSRTLRGEMALGPDNPEEAGKIWNALAQKRGSVSDQIAELQPSLNNSVLNSVIKGIEVPLEGVQCILSRTVLEGRSFCLPSPHGKEEWLEIGCEGGCYIGSEVGCYVKRQLGRDPETYGFATVPLRGKGKVIGVILVDNLYNGHPITEEDIEFLGMFSTQAGLAIENAILYRNLEEVHRELKETEAHMAQQEKMAALGELSASIAHEIKNPLVAIGGFARRLYRAIPEEGPEKRYAFTIIEEVSRLEKVLNQVLTYTRDEEKDFKECDLRDILEDSLSMISEGSDGEGIRVVKQISDRLPIVNGDSEQLRQAFFNLIANARQAMSGEGVLSIRALSASRNGSSCVRVEIEDSGAGIVPENLHNIFNPFFTTKESSLGLGLPIVHKIIMSHRGQIEVDNLPGHGVTFIVILPAREEKSGEGR